MYDVELVLEADRFFLRIVFLARSQLGSKFFGAHLQVQALSWLVTGDAAVSGIVHVRHRRLVPDVPVPVLSARLLTFALVLVLAPVRSSRRTCRQRAALAVRSVVRST